MAFEHLIILFCVIPLSAGLIGVMLVNRRYVSRALGVVSFAATFALAVGLLIHVSGREGAQSILVSQMGAWPAPFGISIVFDSLSGLLLATSSMVALGSLMHSFASMNPETERRYFHPLLQMMMFGVNLSFLTGDLFNLFVAFEVMLMASYALLCLGTSRRQVTQGYKYVLLNLVASTVFVMAAGMAYGMLGTLNLADMARIVAEHEAAGRPMPPGFTALAIMLLLVFGLKGAFFPLWFWLPDTYYTMPIAIGGLFAGMLTKVGVYAVARTFPLIFAATTEGREVIGPIIAVSAVFTMFLGVLGAVSHHEVRRILSVHVISQVGYMVFGIAVGICAVEGTTPSGMPLAAFALAGCVFYMIQHMVVKCSLFLCCGLMEKHRGTDDLDHLGGLLKHDGWLALLFFIAAMSLVGLPPLSGFFGKLTIIQAGWSVPGMWVLSIAGLATGLLTLLSMLKIWSYGFWNPDHAPVENHVPTPRPRMLAGYVGVTLLVVTALFLGFGAEPVYQVAFRAGEQLTDPGDYIEAVLGPEALAKITPNEAALAQAPAVSREALP